MAAQAKWPEGLFRGKERGTVWRPVDDSPVTVETRLNRERPLFSDVRSA